jgi:hypothetical protein
MLRRRGRLGLVNRRFAALLTVSLLGCGSRAPSDGFTGAEADAAMALAMGSDAGPGMGFGMGDAQSGTPSTSCPMETQYVYVVTADNSLYRFNPQMLTFTLIGVLDCPDPTGATPFSMSVDRSGMAWVVFTDGTLYEASTTTAACTATKFVPGQHGFVTFGMGFSSNGAGSQDETLYVTDSPYTSGPSTVLGLASIDTQTLVLSPIGMYDKLDARAEMTGTGSGQLWGAFEGTPYVVAQIDKSNAHILSEAPQTSVSYAPDTSSLAFAFWGGDFWLFVGPGSYTDVFKYDPTSGQTTKVVTEQFEVVGAGVSTCAPIEAPM